MAVPQAEPRPVRVLADEVGIATGPTHRQRRWSGGEQATVAFCRALGQNAPRLLLAMNRRANLGPKTFGSGLAGADDAVRASGPICGDRDPYLETGPRGMDRQIRLECRALGTFSAPAIQACWVHHTPAHITGDTAGARAPKGDTCAPNRPKWSIAARC